MKIKQYKVGDRVFHEYLGNGTVKEIIKDFYKPSIAKFYIVTFDTKPDVRYNGGQKDCLVLTYEIKELL